MSDSAESATPTDAAAAPISAASADDDNITASSSAPSVSNNSDAMSETTGSVENVSVTSAAGTSDVSLKSDSILSDSENANNENRVIEMEGATNPAGPESAEAEEISTVKVDESESCAKSDDKSQSQDKYAEHVSYDEQGEAIYTDPETKYRYKWCKVKNEWIPFDSEHYRWCTESEKWIPKDNPKETEHYRWCEETNQWIPKQHASEQGSVYSSEDGVHHYRDKEGMVHFYDEEKKAWFPKVDDDFMARYQLSYGFGDGNEGKESFTKEEDEIPEDSEEEEPMPEEPPKPQGKKRKAPPEPPKWFELKPEHNTKVYVSNLPLDITEEEFGELMSKCGMVLKDPRTNKLKLKLYRDANGELKGDGLCHYIKVRFIDCQ
ncbi:hypothetical protein RP20_CCG009203 [Aedes albopictus]|nr:hypothetical protein RP20_CCG009203 [Aedes albopictus]